MLTDVQQNYLAQAVKPMQIIICALAGGVLAFLVVVLLLPGHENPGSPFLTYVAFGIGLISLAAWFVVPGIVANQARRLIGEGRPPFATLRPAVSAEPGIVGQLAAVFQTRLIIASALLEGAALFNLIAYMLERQVLGLATAAVLLLIIASQIPTRNRLENWVRYELETIQQMKF